VQDVLHAINMKEKRITISAEVPTMEKHEDLDSGICTTVYRWPR